MGMEYLLKCLNTMVKRTLSHQQISIIFFYFVRLPQTGWHLKITDLDLKNTLSKETGLEVQILKGTHFKAILKRAALGTKAITCKRIAKQEVNFLGHQGNDLDGLGLIWALHRNIYPMFSVHIKDTNLILSRDILVSLCYLTFICRYYSLIEGAIPTSNVAPLSQEWLQEIRNFIPKSLKSENLKKCMKEVTEVSQPSLFRILQNLCKFAVQLEKIALKNDNNPIILGILHSKSPILSVTY